MQVGESEPFRVSGLQREINANCINDVYPRTGSERCVFEPLKEE
jgi:hypothetical protein